MSNLTMKSFTKIIILVSVLIAIIALYILFTLSTQNRPISLQAKEQFTGEANIGGDFQLIDQNNNIFDSSRLKGKLSIIYFGFTFCPDICPTSLGKLSIVLDTLEKYHIDVNAVFISVDPARDKIEILKNYLLHFHPQLIGLTGTEKEIKFVADKFKVYYAKSASTNGDPNHYMLDHTSFIYILDKNGKYLKHFYLTSSAEEIIEFIRINK